ncbi:hypothetical protein WICPIJ_003636 [Wickerhamomyces pijperi]|uniref:Uncharacterized protein n=1 Tax=Wickerhamomyces pijperi TaxID=599730 RepID=A0A9P8TMU7_WICPI|nr:hypothetical protein WICPIJ_003636 [Wickerhamomyces pijperi]
MAAFGTSAVSTSASTSGIVALSASESFVVIGSSASSSFLASDSGALPAKKFNKSAKSKGLPSVWSCFGYVLLTTGAIGAVGVAGAAVRAEIAGPLTGWK